MATVLIRNGRVIDGTGNPWFRADVVIRGGYIDRIGRQIDSIDDDSPDEVVDATGTVRDWEVMHDKFVHAKSYATEKVFWHE